MVLRATATDGVFSVRASRAWSRVSRIVVLLPATASTKRGKRRFRKSLHKIQRHSLRWINAPPALRSTASSRVPRCAIRAASPECAWRISCKRGARQRSPHTTVLPRDHARACRCASGTVASLTSPLPMSSAKAARTCCKISSCGSGAIANRLRNARQAEKRIRRRARKSSERLLRAAR